MQFTPDNFPAYSERAATFETVPLPDYLPRVRIEHDLPEAEKTCACGCGLTRIGEDTSEQLDIVPAQVRVLQHVRLKYACKACEETIKTAPVPAHPIPKSNASPGLLAHVAVAKYQDALPLARQERILQRAGVELPRATLAGWMIKLGALLKVAGFVVMAIMAAGVVAGLSRGRTGRTSKSPIAKGSTPPRHVRGAARQECQEGPCAQKDDSAPWNRFICIDPLWFDDKGVLPSVVMARTFSFELFSGQSTVTGTPWFCSSHAVRRLPWLRGRVSSTKTWTGMPASASSSATMKPML